MQENKNLILAIALCLGVLFGWGYFTEYMGWAPKKPAQEKPRVEARSEAPVPTEIPAPTAPTFTPSPGHDITVDTPLYSAILYSGGGTLRSFILKDYKTLITPDSPDVNLVGEKAAAVAPLGLVINSQPSWSTGQWSLKSSNENLSLQKGKTGPIQLQGRVDGLDIIRNINFSGDTYLISEKIQVTNSTEHSRSIRLAFTQAMEKNISSGSQYDSIRIAWDEKGSLEEVNAADKLANGVQATGEIFWGGPMTTYFLSAVLPGDPQNVTLKGVLAGSVYRAALEEEEFVLQPGQSRELSVSYWLGPKDRHEMAAVSEQLVKSIDLGFFSIIGKCLIWLLEFFNQYVHNWGVSIILLTVALRIVFWPLTKKSLASMEKMKELQPLLAPLKEKYKGDREGLNREVMALYKRYNVNPASGCLPMLIQLPVFFGLYQALLNSLALRHASFITYLPGTDIIWLADLSAKDPLYITPLLMGLTMFLTQRMSPPPADPMQQKIMMFLPVIFTLLFLNFPSGLVIYWTVNNFWQMIQQWLVIHANKTKKAQSATKSSSAKKTK